MDRVRENIRSAAVGIGATAVHEVATRAIGRPGEEVSEPGFWGRYFRDVFQEGTLRVAEDTEAMGSLQEQGQLYAKDQIGEVADGIRVNTRDLVNKAQEKLNPDKKSAYQLYRDRIVNDQDPFFKRILKSLGARVLSFGTTIASYISASWVDKFTGRNEWQENREKFAGIIAG
ncbi:MAG TPA: hypothetical protein VJI32_04420, partial [Candidatus Nanoarchaeia archaeon]|nr:hypothetical protein [Candidatus Nanoarchaeia archaeon]